MVAIGITFDNSNKSTIKKMKKPKLIRVPLRILNRLIDTKGTEPIQNILRCSRLPKRIRYIWVNIKNEIFIVLYDEDVLTERFTYRKIIKKIRLNSNSGTALKRLSFIKEYTPSEITTKKRKKLIRLVIK